MFQRWMIVLSRTAVIHKQCCRCIRGGRSGAISPLSRATNSTEEENELFAVDQLENEIQTAQNNMTKPNKKSAEQQQRELLKKKIIEKKERKLNFPKDPNLLTWAARAQIKHLNHIHPDTWTPNALAHSFPASVATIVKILKSYRLPQDEAEIVKHDRKVYRNWLKLKEIHETDKDGEAVDPEFRYFLENGLLTKMVNASGIHDLPTPKQNKYLQTRKSIAEKLHPAVKGEFSAILEEYEEGKQASAVTESQDIRVEHINFNDPATIKLLSDISGGRADSNVTVSEEVGVKVEAEHGDSSGDTSVTTHKQSRRERRLNRAQSEDINVDLANVDVLKLLKTKRISTSQQIEKTQLSNTSETQWNANDISSSSEGNTNVSNEHNHIDNESVNYLSDIENKRSRRITPTRFVAGPAEETAETYPNLKGTLDDIDMLYKGKKHRKH